MSDTELTPPDALATPWPRRLQVVAAVLLPLFFFLVWAFVRGTWADPVERNPATGADGVVRQLVLASDGHKRVRCAAVVDAPARSVWEVITDYEHFRGVFERLTESQYTRNPDGSVDLRGAVRSRLWGNYKFTARVRHAESADRYEASWDEPGGDLAVNRGNWEVRVLDARRCLLVFSMEVEIADVPDFVVRDVLLGRVKPVVAAVRDHVLSKPSK